MIHIEFDVNYIEILKWVGGAVIGAVIVFIVFLKLLDGVGKR